MFRIPDEPITVVLDLATWNRGGSHGYSLLLGRSGTKCCWGFAALALGLDEAAIMGCAALGELAIGDGRPSMEFAERVRRSGQYEINDRERHSDAERVVLLNQNARLHGLPVRFALKPEASDAV